MACCQALFILNFSFHPSFRGETMKRFALFFFLGTCSLLGGMAPPLLGPHWITPVIAQQPPSTPPSSTDLVRLSDRFEWVMKKVSPSVVAIDATKPASPKGAGAKEIGRA